MVVARTVALVGVLIGLIGGYPSNQEKLARREMFVYVSEMIKHLKL